MPERPARHDDRAADRMVDRLHHPAGVQVGIVHQLESVVMTAPHGTPAPAMIRVTSCLVRLTSIR